MRGTGGSPDDPTAGRPAGPPDAGGPAAPDSGGPPPAGFTPWHHDPGELGFTPAPWLSGPGNVHPGGPPDPVRRAGPRRPAIALVVGVGALVVAALVLLVVVLVRRSPSAPSAAPAARTSAAVTASQSADNGGEDPTGESAADPAQSVPADTDSPVESSSDDPMAAASAIDALLDQSVAARSGVQPALDDIAACAGSNDDLSALDHAATTREDLEDQLDSVDFAAISGGSRLRSALAHVLRVSAAADRAYEAWGQDVSGCAGQADQSDSNKQEGDADSRQATAAKKAFLRQWNPLAQRYGLQTRKQSDI